ncbi:hypothetical protein III_03752 [Bacillus mycoides]|uniref:Uncharacterized protein n=1 Tax=Bacillus mycoides TaxID=1405 RepID=A0ABC9R0G4_BACMY|nr:hypothetical protein III_03752 [Bacillus mycoides]
MDKRLLSMLNELQYSDEEITRLEKEANESINIDKYYVRNGGLLKKLYKCWKSQFATNYKLVKKLRRNC